MRRRLLIIPVVVAVALGGGAAYALATADDDAADTPISGSELDRASAAALAHTGGGRVTGSEVGDEEGAYEIEVTLPEGKQVDVHLDAAFRVIGTEDEADADARED